jgi:rhodanese-related sulfurtransferase
MKTITPHQLHERRKQEGNLQVIDVRTPAEHAEIHVQGVQLIPLDRLNQVPLIKDQPVYLLCRSGSRAKQAAEQLERSGYAECVVVEGGTMAWAEAGLPVNRGTQRVISLERQVRIAAGSLVLIGIILGIWVHPGFQGLSAFVGAGLVFAGITDWCGMGMLIARMPWNQRVSQAAAQTN